MHIKVDEDLPQAVAAALSWSKAPLAFSPTFSKKRISGGHTPMNQGKYQYKLLGITTNDGTILRPDKLTVLVGPNNVGKSRALKEIATHTTLSSPPRSIVVSAVEVLYPQTLDDVRSAYDIERYEDGRGTWMFRVLDTELTQEHTVSGGPRWPSGYEEVFNAQGNNFGSYFTGQFGRAMVAFLTTEARLQLVRESESPSHDRQASSLLQMLYNSGSSATRTVSELAKQTFGQEVALDFTLPQRLLLRVGNDFSRIPSDPRDAKPLMQGYEKLDEQGDGIRSFVGISVALLILKRGLFLIDEPEAFLHPPQAYRIGAFIADQARLSRQIIIATHSADVLRGILSRTQDVNIVRLDRMGSANSFVPLDTNRLKGIINDPLLTSARVLDGLFYSAAIVVEADSDARFYHAASVIRAPDLDLHFVNADNKQTVPRIVRLYRDMGVRSAGIVDFDVLNNRVELKRSLQEMEFDDDEVNELLEAQRTIEKVVGELPPGERLDAARKKLVEVLADINLVIGRDFPSPEREQSEKDQLLRKLEKRFGELADMTKAWRTLKQSGREALSPEAARAFDSLWGKCATHGFFVNPAGELESMLTSYGISWTTNKRDWIIQALKLVPSLKPDDTQYPWKFLRAIHDHLQSNAAQATSSHGEGPRRTRTAQGR